MKVRTALVILAFGLLAACSGSNGGKVPLDDVREGVEAVDGGGDIDTGGDVGKDQEQETCVPKCGQEGWGECDVDDGCGGTCGCPEGSGCYETDVAGVNVCYNPDEACPILCQHDECGLAFTGLYLGPTCDCGPCDDGNPCTNDWCQESDIVYNRCVFDPIAGWCDDGDPCTTDACKPFYGGCTHTKNTSACDDGNQCTLNDHCWQGVCDWELLDACDDGDPYTTDLCDPAVGCLHSPAQ